MEAVRKRTALDDRPPSRSPIPEGVCLLANRVHDPPHTQERALCVPDTPAKPAFALTAIVSIGLAIGADSSVISLAGRTRAGVSLSEFITQFRRPVAPSQSAFNKPSDRLF